MNRFIRKINDSKVILDPFPHLEISNIFSEDLYQDIRDNWPDVTTARPNLNDYDASAFENRKWAIIYPERTSEFWNELGAFLASSEVKEAIFKKLIPKEYGALDIETSCVVRCITDSTGYSIPPHRDVSLKILSMLLYMPEDDSHPEWGTSAEGITIPFLPNYLFAFSNAERPLHCVNEIKAPNAKRDQILVVWNQLAVNRDYVV